MNSVVQIIAGSRVFAGPGTLCVRGPWHTRRVANSLILSDATDLHDVDTFLKRSAGIRDGVCRIVARGRVAALHTAFSFPLMLTDPAPVIIAQRGVRLTQQTELLDVVVPLAELRDRMPRAVNAGRGQLRVPPQRVNAPWTSLVPLQAQWEPGGTVVDDAVYDAGAEVARIVNDSLPDHPGQPVVVQARNAVWGKTLGELGVVTQDDHLAPMLAGAAFTAQALGFVARGQRSRVFASGMWRRLSCHGGTLLYRAGLS